MYKLAEKYLYAIQLSSNFVNTLQRSHRICSTINIYNIDINYTFHFYTLPICTSLQICTFLPLAPMD